MKRQAYDAAIKVRVAKGLKKQLEAEATVDDLELSDIVRRALKLYAMRTKTSVFTQVA